MKTELTLLERRNIAKLTVSGWGWHKIMINTHKKETYDEFNIPIYEECVDQYFKTHPILVNPKCFIINENKYWTYYKNRLK